MEILHLTDLHIDPEQQPPQSLHGIWNAAKSPLPQRWRKFDFVVITGDLTHAAQQSEYDALLVFLDRLVEEHVANRDRRRVIIVPGNHDVDWSGIHGEAIDAARLATDAPLRNEFKEYLRDPEHSQLRVKFDEYGRILRLWRIDPKSYQKRFHRCADFFDSFYRGSFPKEETNDSALALRSPDEERHWSAHVFSEEKVVFYGLNSCHRTDQDWRGATLAEQALDAAKGHADLLAAKGNWTRIVVWHHGLRSDRGNPDVLTRRELEKIGNLAPTLGMHGHTHQDEVDDLRDTIRYPFPIVATGSFAAAQNQRPDAPNQFSVITMTRSLIRWERYNRTGSGAWVRPAPGDEIIFTRKPVGRSLPQGFQSARTKAHERRVCVNEQGIAEVTVRLEELDGVGSFALARVLPSFNNLDFDREAETRTDPLPIAASPQGDGSRLFTIGNGPNVLPLLQWSYGVSNSFALTQSDLAVRDRGDSELRLDDDHDAFGHVVKSQCGRLDLEIAFNDENGPVARIDSVKVRADRRRSNEPGAWEEDEEETRAIAFDPVSKGRVSSARLSVPEPIPGHRYVLLYRPAEAGNVISNDIQVALQGTLSRCRARLAQENRLRQHIERQIEDAVLHALRVRGDGDPVRWLGYLWDSDDRRLLPSFGNCPPREWCSRFAHGEGIVGHAFRMGQPSVYFSDANGRQSQERRSSLIYRKASDARREGLWLEEHQWIVALPVLINLGGPAVGVVAFSDFEDDAENDTVGRRLRRMAEDITRLRRNSAKTTSLDELMRAISCRFWFSLAHSNEEEIGEMAVGFARGVLDQHWPQASFGASETRMTAAPRVLAPTSRDAAADNRRSPRTSDGCDKMVASMRCDLHGAVPVKVTNQSSGGFGVITDRGCPCIRRDTVLHLVVDGTEFDARVRHTSSPPRGIEGLYLGLALAASA